MQLNDEALDTISVAAKVISALGARANSDGVVALDAQGFNLSLAAIQALERLKQALAECGFGPDLCDVEGPLVSFPSGEEGLIYDALWELWQFCYEDDAERRARLNLDRTISVLSVALDLRKQATPTLVESPPADAVNSVRRVGNVWHICYQGESGDYPVTGNQCIDWLQKLLGARNRKLSVAELRGDPEGKLAADAMLGAEPEMDREAIADAKRRLEEIGGITEVTGGSEQLQEEAAQLLCLIKEGPSAKTLTSQLKRDHANIATQLRGFRRKLETAMPQLAAHLKASLDLAFPEFGYYPPPPPPDWQF